MIQQKILLESGTNEVEILEFFLGTQSYGINVLKIKQIIAYDASQITQMPKSHPAIEGTIYNRGEYITLINLSNYLNIEDKDLEYRAILITDFNQKSYGFRVDDIRKIHRISWQDIQPVQSNVTIDKNWTTGVCKISERSVLVLDFESITGDLFGGLSFEVGSKDLEGKQIISRRDKKIFLADDSAMVRSNLEKSLKAAGYESISCFDNGEDLYQEFMKVFTKSQEEEKSISEYIDLVISDIEMPDKDGLTLCKQIKELAPKLPVIILSSLINEQIETKCDSVNANDAISKNEINRLLKTVDYFTGVN